MKTLKIAVITTLLAVSTASSAFWGNGNQFGNGAGNGTGTGEGSFSFGMSAKSNVASDFAGNGNGGYVDQNGVYHANRSYGNGSANGTGNGTGEGSFSFSMSGNAKAASDVAGNGTGNGYGYQRPAYGYAPYYGAPAAPVAPTTAK
jgi:hypothetical protein